jgi:hypothetical protein
MHGLPMRLPLLLALVHPGPKRHNANGAQDACETAEEDEDEGSWGKVHARNEAQHDTHKVEPKHIHPLRHPGAKYDVTASPR